jgi:hypothetical protein
VDDLGERRIDRHWWNETKATAEGVTNAQAQAWLVRADDAGRLAKALLEARAEVERLTACWSSLVQLVALKDGPRDDTYYSERESAWAGARKALAEYEPPARAALPGEEGTK